MGVEIKRSQDRRAEMINFLWRPIGSHCGLMIAFPVLLMIAALCFSGNSVRAAAAGTVAGVNGTCLIYSGNAWTVLSLGQPVQVGDAVDVPAGGKLKLRMADGSTISVASGSRITIAGNNNLFDDRQGVRLWLWQGLLRALVTPLERPAGFEVETAAGSAVVRSTDWFVEASPSGMQVSVLTGTVALTTRTTGQGVIVPARSGASIAMASAGGLAGSLFGAGGIGAAAGAVGPVGGVTPPRPWSQGEFDAFIARTDLK